MAIATEAGVAAPPPSMAPAPRSDPAAPPPLAPRGPRRPHRGGRSARLDRTYLVMIIPVLILFTAFIVFPALTGVFFSFTNYAGYGDWTFIGVSNYLNMLKDPSILQAYLFTFFFALVSTVVVNVLSLSLAVALNAKIKWRTGMRTLFFIPMVLSGLVVAYVFNYLFSNTIPAIAESLGLTPLTSSILSDERFAWIAIVFVTVWQAAPGVTIIYLAGLQAIPSEVHEAAELDGAGGLRTFSSITLPLILGYLVINVILGFKGYLGAYEIIVALTAGGPGTATQSVAMKIFSGFNGGDYAYQMANAVVFFVITVIISLIQLRMIQRRGVTL